ncbi:T9SS type A sorting domain-containing protein [Flavobacterium sp. 3HN19-14]|uniref:T9SS type A sorting domain-containing protein n=1 Tax=Flavobacterium sp. 3HN19-14 TaxID=3448133 RepID=UPI003EE39670
MQVLSLPAAATYVGGANGGGIDANTTKTQNVTLTADNCFSVELLDTYGDGWNLGNTPHGLEIFSADNTSLLDIPVGNFGTLLSKGNALTTTNLGVATPEVKSFGLYPNPSTGIVNINTDSPVNVAVMDVTGKVVFSASNVTSQTQLNLSGLQKGMYIAKISGENTSTTEKVILK